MSPGPEAPTPPEASGRDRVAGDPTRNLVVAVLVGAALLMAAIVLVVVMTNQPQLDPIPIPTVAVT